MDNRFTKEEYLCDMIKDSLLPLTMRITRNKKHGNRLCLKEGQHLTVLGIDKMQVLKGFDHEGRQVLINNNNDTQINVIEELAPSTEQDFCRVRQRITLILLKKKFGYKSTICESGETFFIQDYDSSDKRVMLLRDKDSTIITVPLDVLLDPLFFSLAEIKAQKQFSESIASLQEGDVIHFTGCNFPSGFVHVEGIKSIEVVHTVTVTSSSKKLLYQTYPRGVNNVIVGIRTYRLPKHVELLGDAYSPEFLGKLEELRFLTFYDCYASMVYGSFSEENFYWELDLDFQIEDEKNKNLDSTHSINKQSDLIPVHKCKLKTSRPLLQKLSPQKLLGKKTAPYQKSDTNSSKHQENSDTKDENNTNNFRRNIKQNKTSPTHTIKTSTERPKGKCNGEDTVTDLDEDTECSDDEDVAGNDDNNYNGGNDNVDDHYESIDVYQSKVTELNLAPNIDGEYEDFTSFAVGRERENPIYGTDPLFGDELQSHQDHVYESIKLRPLCSKNPLPDFTDLRI